MTNNFIAEIFEFPEGAGSPLFISQQLYFHTLTGFWRLEQDKARKIFEYAKHSSFSRAHLNNRLWMRVQHRQTGEIQQKIVELNGPSAQIRDMDATEQKAPFNSKTEELSDGRWLGIELGKNREREIYLYDPQSHQAKRKNLGRKTYDHASDGERIYLRNSSTDNVLIALDMDLRELWRRELAGTHRTSGMLVGTHQDLVIVLDSHLVYGIHGKTGETAWTYVLSDFPTSHFLEDSTIYFSDNGQGYILDASQGTLMRQLHTGFQGHMNDRPVPHRRNQMTLHPCPGYLVACSHFDHQIKIFPSPDSLSSGESQCLQTMEFPYYDKNDQGGDGVGENAVCLNLIGPNAYRINGLLIVRPARPGEEPGVRYTAKPEIHLLVNEPQDGPHGWKIFVNHQDLERVKRYAPIAVKELAFEARYAKDAKAVSDWIDEQHNGAISLIIDPRNYTEQEKTGLERMAAQLQEDLDDPLSWDDRPSPPLKLELRYQPKEHWNMSGKVLDMDALRKRDQTAPAVNG